MSDTTWKVSPQQIDPLSWLTRPYVPLTLAALCLGINLATIIATWGLAAKPWLDLIALALMVGALLVVHVETRPLRRHFSPRNAILPLVMTFVGLVVATFSASDSTVLVQHWWAPTGVSFVIGCLGPYSNVRALLRYGTLFVVVTAVCGLIAFSGTSDVWPGFSVAIISAISVIIATAATATFAWSVVAATRALLVGAGTVPEPSEAASEEAARRVERRTLARLGSRVAPFLAEIADAGEVTAADRAVAGRLAAQLRSDLVIQANRSWLDRVALVGRISVIDPDTRADRMNAAQRTALRALLIGVMTHPAATVGSLVIDLRGLADGSTAVALSLDFALPEGTRTSMLAPYYVTLQATVQSLSWDSASDVLKFQLAPPGE